ncbi:MAG: LytTR family DNA-binding domain-containing protein [Acholeplasmataceae bacterium]
MIYKIAVVEDDPISTQMILNHLRRFEKEENVDFNIETYTDGVQITFDYESKYDIIFLDIEMKIQDGMETAHKIRELDSEVIIIFVTNMSQYAIKGYTVGALSFLLKPLPYFSFKQELNKSLERLSKTKIEKNLLIPTEDGVKKISSNDILFIESIKHDVNIIVKDHSNYQLRGTLKNYENKLIEYNFNRCNNSYLVNLNYVSGVEGDFVVIDNKFRLKISRPRKKQFLESLSTFLGN